VTVTALSAAAGLERESDDANRAAGCGYKRPQQQQQQQQT